MTRNKLIRLLACVLLCALSLLLPACTMPEVPDGEAGGGGELPPAPTPVVYSEGLAYEEVTSDSPLLDRLQSGSISLPSVKRCIITGIGTCTDRDIVIPTTINGMQVIGVADRAFSAESDQPATRSVKSTKGVVIGFLSTSDEPVGDEGEETSPTEPTEIESVTLPSTLLSIGEEAFYGCEALADVLTPNLVQLIGKDAFKDTAYYNDPTNWEGDVLYLETYLVSVKPSLTGSLAVKDGTTVIADRAFYGCAGLTQILFPSTVKEIGAHTFYGCTALRTLDLNCRELSIGSSAFEGCTALDTVKIGFDGELYHPGMAGVEVGYDSYLDENGVLVAIPNGKDPDGRPFVYPCRIRYHAFKDCTALKNVELRRSVSFIGGGTFTNCASLESISLPDAVTNLNLGAVFIECPLLKSVDLGNGLTVIGTQTFYKCPALTELSFPDGVTAVSDVAWFSGVKRLRLGPNVKMLTWTQNSLEYVEFGGTVTEWKELTSKSLVFLAPAHTVVCRDGTLTKTPPPDAEEPTKIYEVISAGAYNNLMNGGLPQNYTAIFERKAGDSLLSVETAMTENGFHQWITSFDGEQWELHGVTEGGETTVYTKRNGKWYRSTASLYDPFGSPFEWELPFAHLSHDEETHLYSYAIPDSGISCEMGFCEDRLVYAALHAEDVRETSVYSDFGRTVLPDFSVSDVVEGVVLDINGDIVA